MSLSRLQSSVPTLIGSSVRIFKERVASFATRFGILQKSNQFCKWRSKLFCFSLSEALPILHESPAPPHLSSSLLSAKGAHYGSLKNKCQALFTRIADFSKYTHEFSGNFFPIVDRRPIVLTANASKHYKNAANSPTSYISLLSFTPRFSISPAVPLHYVPEKSADCGCFLSE